MQIKNLNLKNFRNYRDEIITFTDGLNVISGKNAQGKTNCAEGVFYLCTGTSPRCRKDKQLIRQGEEFAFLTATAEGLYGELTISATIFENSREVRVNGNKITRNADILGNIFSVFFSPHELRLIQDGPDERRRFLNISISQLSKAYYVALSRYNKILEQRNNLLKSNDIEVIYGTLPIWDEQLAKYAASVAYKRNEFISNLAPFAKDIHLALTDGNEEIDITPDKSYKGGEKDIKEQIFSGLQLNYERDMRLGFTSIGPHRDDLNITINGLDAKNYASQGQTRTAALSIKLAEVEIFKKMTGEYPILILDDVLSELDMLRRKKLISRIEHLQTILTCTHIDRTLCGKAVNKIRIEDGKVK